MSLTFSDKFLLCLTAWRENALGGLIGMQSVMNVIINRALQNHTSPYLEAIEFKQFSSINAPGNTLSQKWASPKYKADYTAWVIALKLVEDADAGNLKDITNGATNYYAPKAISSLVNIVLPDDSVHPWPVSWGDQSKYIYTGTIADQLFFKTK